ncbi:PglL family O-oligosaccharyltransferase [Acinetobacter sp. YH12112]|uniref:PglL family O-oligosaccharyltransferase n=1 Tax=Acinetobacter sp. YH12112 TaxID=2601099 RepID=UPI0015D3D89D|nr:O-antigen ligase family protein [Acinetobacter sp. YH12112]
MKKILILFAVLCASFAWLSPNHIFPWASSHGDFSIFLSLLLLLVYAVAHYKKLFISSINLPFLIIASVPLLQFFFQKIYFLGDALVASIYIFGFFIALMIGNTIGQDDKNKKYSFKIVCWLILLVALISVYIQLLQWLMIERHGIFVVDLTPGGRPYANFAQANNFATFLVMAVISTCYLYEAKVFNASVLALLSAVFLFAIALTQSRTPWVYLIFFCIWWWWKASSARLNIKSWWVFSGVLYLVVCSVIIIPFLSKILGLGFAINPLNRAVSGFHRLEMWKEMLIAIGNAPWSGYGWNQVSVAQVETTLEFSSLVWMEHTHNLILDIFVWTGIPLGGLISLFLIFWLVKYIDKAFCKENFLMLAMVGGVIVHAMFEFPLHYAFFLLPTGLILGLIQSDTDNINTRYIPISFFSGLSISLLCLLMFVKILSEYRVIEKDIESARYESLNIGLIAAKHRTPDIQMLTQLSAHIALIRTEPRSNMSLEEIEEVRKAAYRFSSAAALYRYAQVLALNGHIEKAKEQLIIIEKLHEHRYSWNSLYIVQPNLAFEWMNQGASK